MFQNNKKPSFLSKIKSGLLGLTKRNDESKTSFISFVRRTPRRTLFGSVFTLILLLGGAVALRLTQQSQDVRQQAISIDFCEGVSSISWGECAALVDLYKYTGGADWTNNEGWLVTTDPCDADEGWYGITCSDSISSSTFKTVKSISLTSNNLVGVLPQSIGNLQQLHFIDFYDNQLSGNIPAEIGQLANLIDLLLQKNQLSGTIPVEIGQLANLNTLNLTSNQFSGTIPPEIGNLAKLEYLYLESNNYSGTLPSFFWDMNSLKGLGLEDNQFTGSIPNEIERLTNLEKIDLNNNQLSGNIPTQIGNLTKLYSLNLQNNQLTGEIPPSIGDLSNLEVLYLSNNQLTGSIPTEIGKLTKLEWLLINDNLLEGQIPTSFADLSQLYYFHWTKGNYLCLPQELINWHDSIYINDDLTDSAYCQTNQPISHRDGSKWCKNHGGIVVTVDHDVHNWSECLAWCDTVMNQSKPLCQYNADSPRSCWVNYAPDGANGDINQCYWIPGTPPFGAWWIGFEDQSTIPTVTPSTPPSENNVGQVVGYVFFDSNENGVHDCNVVTKVGAECQWPAGKYYDDAWKWRITASGPTSASANSNYQSGWYQTNNVPLGNYVVSLGDVAGQTKAEQYKLTTPQIQNTVVGTNAQKTYVNGRVDYGVIPISMSTGTSPCSIADRADINCDGQINMTDYNLLINSFTF